MPMTTEGGISDGAGPGGAGRVWRLVKEGRRNYPSVIPGQTRRGGSYTVGPSCQSVIGILRKIGAKIWESYRTSPHPWGVPKGVSDVLRPRSKFDAITIAKRLTHARHALQVPYQRRACNNPALLTGTDCHS